MRDRPDLQTSRSSWRGRVKTGRRVVVRPTGLAVATLLVGASLICLAVIAYGVVTVSVFWSICAGLAGAAVLAVTLRGFPLFAVAPVFIAAFLWGLAMRPWLPDHFLGVFKFLGGNLAFDVPLVGAYLAAIAMDSRRLSRLAIDEAVSGRRWWVEGTDRPSGPPPLRELEAIPASRFFVLDQGPCSHLVVSGRQVALLMSATWKPGAMTLAPDGQVLRSGQPYAQGTDDLEALAGEVRLWLERLGGTGARVRGYLVVAPTGDELVVEVPPAEHVEIVPAYAFSDTVGGWLASQPYRIDLAVMERLLKTAVPEFASDRAVAPEYGAALRRRMRRGAPPPAPVPPPPPPASPPSALPVAPAADDDWADFSSWHEPASDAPAWDSDSARRLAEWAAEEAPIPGPPVGSRPADPLPVALPTQDPSPDLVVEAPVDQPPARPVEPSDEPLEFRNWPTIKPVPPASLAPLRFEPEPEPDWMSEPVEDEVAAVEPVPAAAPLPLASPEPEPEPEPTGRSWRSRLRRAFEPVREPVDEPAVSPVGPPEVPPVVAAGPSENEPSFDAWALRADTPRFPDEPARSGSSRYDALRSLSEPEFQPPPADPPFRSDDLVAWSSSLASTPDEEPDWSLPPADESPSRREASTSDEPPAWSLPPADEPASGVPPSGDEPAWSLPRADESPLRASTTDESPAWSLPVADEPASGASTADELPSRTGEAPRWTAARFDSDEDADTPPFHAPAMGEPPGWRPSRIGREPDAEPSFGSHPWPAPAEQLAPPPLPALPAAAEPAPEPETPSRRSRRKKEPEPTPPEREPRGWRGRRKRGAEPAPPPEPVSNDPQQSRLWQAARALDPAPIDPTLSDLEPRRASRHSSEPVADHAPEPRTGRTSPETPEGPDRLERSGRFGSDRFAPDPEARPSRFEPEPTDRPDRVPPPPAERPGLFGSGPDRSAPAERPGLFGSDGDSIGPAERPGLFGSDGDSIGPAERPGLFGSDGDSTRPADRPRLFGSEPDADQPGERSGRFGPDPTTPADRSGRFGPEPDANGPAERPEPFGSEPDDRFRRFRPEPAESPSAFQPPDRSDRYADDRPEAAPGQVDFGRLRKFGRPAEEPGSHRAAPAPEWATSGTWDDQQEVADQQPAPDQQRPVDQPEPEPRGRGRRGRRAEPGQAAPAVQDQKPEAADQPTEKKSRRQQRRDRKTQPDETEVWLSGLSSSEPLAWEGERGQGRTAPNDGLGLAEDLAEIKRPAARSRGSLFEEGAEDTWNSPAPTSDGDDWWEATPRRGRRNRDSKD